jgi:hypothetical protein
MPANPVLYLPTCLYACQPGFVPASLPICMPACQYACQPLSMHANLAICLPSCLFLPASHHASMLVDCVLEVRVHWMYVWSVCEPVCRKKKEINLKGEGSMQRVHIHKK